MVSGRMGMLFDLMEEGTKKYPQFGASLETYGMEFEAGPGSFALSVLPEDLECGLELAMEYIREPLLAEDAFEKVKDRTLADIRQSEDDPESCARRILREQVYGSHPYGRTSLGKSETISSLKIDSMHAAYQEYITPQELVIVISGACEGYDIPRLIASYFGTWQGRHVKEVLNELPKPTVYKRLFHSMQRDQVVLAYGGLSVARFDQRYDSLLIYDQLFGGGVTGSMRSRLFNLREKTGMFYSIGGTLLSGASKHPGMIYIRALTSASFVKKAADSIDALLERAAEGISVQDIEEARRAILYSLVALYETDRQLATSLVFLHRNKLSQTYFRDRAYMLQQVTQEAVQKAVEEVVKRKNLMTIEVGRS